MGGPAGRQRQSRLAINIKMYWRKQVVDNTQLGDVTIYLLLEATNTDDLFSSKTQISDSSAKVYFTKHMHNIQSTSDQAAITCQI